MKRRQFILSIPVAAAGAAMLARGAQAAGPSGDVTLYSYPGEHLEVLQKEFKALYPDINTRIVTGEGGALQARLLAEQGRPQADVVILSADQFLNYPQLFKPYRSNDHQFFPDWGLIKDGDTVYGYGYTISIQVFGYNTSRLPTAEAPKSWKEILDPRFKGKFAVANPAISTAGYGSFLQLLQTYGWDGVKSFIDNAKFSSSTALIPQSVARGEEALAIFEETKATELTRKGYPVAISYPTEGIAPTVEGVGLIMNSPNADNGLLLAEFINSKQGHAVNVSVRNRRTPRTDSAPPVGLPALASMPVNPKYDFVEGMRKHDEWVARFNEMLQARSR